MIKNKIKSLYLRKNIKNIKHITISNRWIQEYALFLPKYLKSKYHQKSLLKKLYKYKFILRESYC